MGNYVFLLDENRMPEALPDVGEGNQRIVLMADASSAERLAAVETAEVIFGEPTAEELRWAKKLRWVQMFWAGADRYLDGSFPGQAALTMASGAFGETIAEHALSMLLALCRRLPAYGKRRDWRDLGAEKRISGGTALIFGAGDIGTAIGRRLQALGVRTVGVCRNAGQPRPGFDVLTTLLCSEAFLPEADFVLCALPASEETVGFLDGARLALLRQDAVLINVGRGSLIDTKALTQALEMGKFFGVGLDVVHPEPLPPEHPLWNMERVILTPHVAGVSFGHDRQTEHGIWEICRENIERYQRGLPLRNRVVLP